MHKPKLWHRYSFDGTLLGRLGNEPTVEGGRQKAQHHLRNFRSHSNCVGRLSTCCAAKAAAFLTLFLCSGCFWRCMLK